MIVWKTQKFALLCRFVVRLSVCCCGAWAEDELLKLDGYLSMICRSFLFVNLGACYGMKFDSTTKGQNTYKVSHTSKTRKSVSADYLRLSRSDYQTNVFSLIIHEDKKFILHERFINSFLRHQDETDYKTNKIQKYNKWHQLLLERMVTSTEFRMEIRRISACFIFLDWSIDRIFIFSVNFSKSSLCLFCCCFRLCFGNEKAHEKSISFHFFSPKSLQKSALH